MSSIRDINVRRSIAMGGALVTAVLAVAAGGCQSFSQTQVAQYEPTPIPEDAAMKQRDWSQSSLTYSSTAVAHSTTHFAYRPEATMGDGERLIVEPVIFLGQSIAFPVMLFVDPPVPFGVNKESRGEVSGATYTANPPTPGAIPPSPTAYFYPPLNARGSFQYVAPVPTPSYKSINNYGKFDTKPVRPSTPPAVITPSAVETPRVTPPLTPQPTSPPQPSEPNSPSVVPVPVPQGASQGASQ